MSPTVSIIIPSLNQGEFLEETITSLLCQSGINLELIVMDGGSTDRSVEIIEKYSSKIAFWQSQPDGGQAAAINAGFERSTGEVLGWLNSDDFLFPGALEHVASKIDSETNQMLAGNCFHFREGSPASWGSDIEKCFQTRDLRLSGFLLQPSTFWTRSTWDTTGSLDDSLHYTFDWDWFIRASTNTEIRTTPRYLSAYRYHENHKTGTGGEARCQEIRKIYKRHASPDVLLALEEIERLGFGPEQTERLLARLRLQNIRPVILKALFPRIYSNLSLKEVSQIRYQYRS